MIRSATIDDLDCIYNIYSETSENPWSRVLLEAEFYKDYSYSYVYEIKHEIYGYATIWDLSGEAEIINIAVRPKYQKQGIGKEMLTFILTLFDSNVVWYLEVACNNYRAVKMYELNGFEKTGIIKNYYGENQHAYRMCRNVYCT